MINKQSTIRVLLAVSAVALGGCTLGPTELLIILAIVLLLFGATRLPQLGKAVGETLRSFKESSGGEEKKSLDSKDVAQIEEAKVEPISNSEKEKEKEKA